VCVCVCVCVCVSVCTPTTSHHRSFPVKKPNNDWLFCGERPTTYAFISCSVFDEHRREMPYRTPTTSFHRLFDVKEPNHKWLFCGKRPTTYPFISCDEFDFVHSEVIFLGLFLQKSPIITGSFAKRDLQLDASCVVRPQVILT